MCQRRPTDVAVDAFPALSTDTLVVVDAVNTGATIQTWILLTVIYVYRTKQKHIISGSYWP
jgi:hypothetical protein